MDWLRNRLREGSTIAGLLGMIPQVVTIIMSGATPAAVAGLVIGVTAVLVPESVLK